MNDNKEITIVKEIADRMRDPEYVRSQITDPANKNPSHPESPWKSLSLSHGYPAILLLFTTLNDLFPEEGWDQVSHSYVLKIKETIEKEQIAELSLFGGLAGCCFALQAASQKKTRYQKLLSKMNEYLAAQTQKEYLTPLREKIELRLPAKAEFYDPISGITGIGIYALRNLDDPALYSLLKELLHICVALSRPLTIGKYTVPGWYIPSHYQFTEQDKKNYPKGNFNLGMAHGVSALLAFLSLSFSQKVYVEGQSEAIERISTWLQSKKIESNHQIHWSDRISFEREVGLENETPSHYIMDAWCYGTAGVSRSLYLAGKAQNNIELQTTAAHAFLSATKRIEADQEISNPTFCHGIAGFLTLTKLMARDTRLNQLEKSAVNLKERLCNLYDQRLPFGFKDHEPLLKTEFILKDESKRNQIIQLDNAGLLSGVPGVLLSLLPSNHTWTYPFLIDGGL